MSENGFKNPETGPHSKIFKGYYDSRQKNSGTLNQLKTKSKRKKKEK